MMRSSMWVQPVYTRVEELRMDARTLVVVCGLVLVLAPAPSSLALHLEVNHAQHHHPVDMGQWRVRAPGDVRCYCNLPACITTGYMCKSAGKGCFSDLVDHVDVYRARHGCLDLLDSERQRQCKNQPRPDPEVEDVPAWERGGPEGGAEGGPAPPDAPPDSLPDTPSPSLLLCCTEDMCNHIDSPDSRMRQGPNGSSDAAHVTMSSPAGVPLGLPGAAGAAARSAEMWFKAATIAVPICGALILVLLIVLAVRLLRADSQHQRASKLSACAFPPLSEKKVPLLPCGQGVNRLDCLPEKSKNHTLAKINYSASYDLLDFHKEQGARTGAAGANNNHNMFLGAQGVGKYSYKQVLASFVPWGSSSSADPPTNV